MSISLVQGFPYSADDYKTKSNEESYNLVQMGSDYTRFVLRSFFSLVWSSPVNLTPQEAVDALNLKLDGRSLAVFGYIRAQIRGLIDIELISKFPGLTIADLTEEQLTELLDAALPADCRPVTECVPYVGASGAGVLVTELPWKLARPIVTQASRDEAVAYAATLV